MTHGTAYDIHDAIEHFNTRYKWVYNHFYNDDEWGRIYNANDYYKNEFLAPFERLCRISSEELHFQRYTNGDFYVGQINSQQQRHGMGYYYFHFERDDDNEAYHVEFVGIYQNNKRTDWGSYLHISADDCKTFFKSIHNNFYLTPLNGAY